MELLIIRHGKAENAGVVPGGDAARPLSEYGSQQFRKVAHWIGEHQSAPELILHSPLVRTTQTAQILQDVVELNDELCYPQNWLGFGLNLESLISFVRSSEFERIAIIAHMPDVARCTADLIGGGSIIFKPGNVACIKFDTMIGIGLGSLKWHLSAPLF
ncbi:phosphohistidine phosphatase SixA [Gimesia aquarii]|uniref:Phosphohistidine phosphatase SixA n=1 Tax=Gimesia aquarii TaxID=2527964 RepID=A0A517VYP1_9PLAN|nr:phosphohistidine phosphatase SixA [Gimesia aquarii]QDT98117.1 Phosphohistidine phosphatase SixA [Gimesia aquarii]